MQPPSCLFSGNAAFIEDLYERYLADPEAVDAGWRDYFASLQTDAGAADVAHGPVRERFQARAMSSAVVGAAAALQAGAIDDGKQVSVLQLINAHRFMGHRQARLDPLNQHERP